MRAFSVLFFVLILSMNLKAQQTTIDQSKYPPLVTYTADQDHDNMLGLLGIKVLRPGASGN